MTLSDTGGELLRTDSLGRVHTPRTRREAILDEFERSGGSGAQFAALLGIKYPTFANWVQQRRRQRRLAESQVDCLAKSERPQSSNGPVWLEAVVQTPSASGGLRMQLPGGAEVVLTDAQQVPLLAGLLRELQLGGKALPC